MLLLLLFLILLICLLLPLLLLLDSTCFYSYSQACRRLVETLHQALSKLLRLEYIQGVLEGVGAPPTGPQVILLI